MPRISSCDQAISRARKKCLYSSMDNCASAAACSSRSYSPAGTSTAILVPSAKAANSPGQPRASSSAHSAFFSAWTFQIRISISATRKDLPSRQDPSE